MSFRFLWPALCLFATNFAQAAPGDPDPSFGEGGRVLTPFPEVPQLRSFHLGAMAIQADGKIVLAGGAGFGGFSASSTGSIFVARYLPNGQLDADFGEGGKALMTFADCGIDCSTVAIDRKGRILAGGRKVENRGTTSEIQYLIAVRFLPDGKPDTGFGEEGAWIHGDPYRSFPARR